MDAPADARAAAQRISAHIATLADWRGRLLARVRAAVHRADPQVVEAWKWRGTPVWCHDGILCTGEVYSTAVKLTFAHGAALADPTGLFNASLTGSTRRAIDLREGDRLDERDLVALVRDAVRHNREASAGRRRRR